MTRFKLFGFLLPLAMAGGMALGLMSAPAAAHDCARHIDKTHKHCDVGGDGTKYTVQLLDSTSSSDGAFWFCPDEFGVPQGCGEVAVSASSDGALLVGEKTLLLNRPNVGDDLKLTWDGVFKTCPALFGDKSPPPDGGTNTLQPDNWRVMRTTGKAKGAGSQVDQVRVQFIRAMPDDLEIEVTLQLIARDVFIFDNTHPFTFLPGAGKTKRYALEHYSIFGSSLKGTKHPRLQCDHTGADTLFSGIDLVITRDTE